MADGSLMLDTDRSLSLLRSFRRDENHTVGTTRTVDGCSRSILQNLYGSDVGRIDLGEISSFTEREAVHHDKRGV